MADKNMKYFYRETPHGFARLELKTTKMCFAGSVLNAIKTIT